MEASLLAYAEASRDVMGAVVTLVAPNLDSGDAVRDLTPMRGSVVEQVPDRRADGAEESVSELEGLLGAVEAESEGLDLLTLLNKSARAAQGGTLYVVSSGLQTAAPVDFRTLGWEFNVEAVVADLSERGLIADFSHLDEIVFVGLGQTADSQPEPGEPELLVLQELWLALCRAGGAAKCSLDSTLLPDVPPTATLPVPLVPVPLHATPCIRPLPALATDVLFEKNSAVLLPGADDVLRPLAQQLADASRHCSGLALVDVVGHVADTDRHRFEGQDLSLQRARTVARRLIDLGAPAHTIGQITGAGDSEPLLSNWSSDGTFDEPSAARNRRVELRTSNHPDHQPVR